MATSIEQRSMTITIHIKKLVMQISEDTSFKVFWIRGNQKADTKVKIINSNTGTSNINEKFQISTTIEVNVENG